MSLFAYVILIGIVSATLSIFSTPETEKEKKERIESETLEQLKELNHNLYKERTKW